MGHCHDRADHVFWEDFKMTLEYCVRKATECSMLGELFCRNLEDKNVEGNAVHGCLASEL